MFKAIEQAKADGGQVLCGAKRVAGPWSTVRRTHNHPHAAQTGIVKQETFAPILYILEYERFEDAIETAQ